jgi:RNA recognition motif-containing protein
MSKKPIPAIHSQKVAQPIREEKIVEPTKVFVSNLPWTTSVEELIAAFCTIGEIVDVQLRYTRGGRSLGCGVVEFSNHIYAQNCIHTMNGQDFNGRNLAVREYYQ